MDVCDEVRALDCVDELVDVLLCVCEAVRELDDVELELGVPVALVVPEFEAVCVTLRVKLAVDDCDRVALAEGVSETLGLAVALRVTETLEVPD